MMTPSSLFTPRWPHRNAGCRRPQCFPTLLLLLCLLGGAISCSGDTATTPTLRNGAQAYWALQLDQHAVNLATIAPSNTVQLHAVPLTEAGAGLTDSGSVHFRASDSSVTVDATGFVTAHFATRGGSTKVIASFTTQGVTLTDTVFFQVTDTVPQHPLTTFSMQPVAGDSAKRAYSTDNAIFIWPVTARDAAGNTLCNQHACALQVYYTSSNPTVATINRSSGQVAIFDTGNVVFTATTLAYGVVRRDSVQFRMGAPVTGRIFIRLDTLSDGRMVPTFHASHRMLFGIGAAIEFLNYTPQAVDVVFDDSTAVAPDAADDANLPGYYLGNPPTSGGNITMFGGDTTSDVCINFGDYPDCGNDIYLHYQNVRFRTFPRAGTVRFHSSLFPSDTFTLVIQ